MKIRLVMTLLVLALLTAAANAELYRWVDDTGTLNFTEDFQSIPAKYRKSAQSSDDVSAEPAPAEPAADKALEPPARGDSKGAAVVPLYNGKRGEEWRDDIRQARAEVKAYQDHLAMKRRMLSDTSRMGRQEFLGLQYDVKELEVKVGELQGRLDQLTRDAERAGVPANFR
jgi:hypothetical protein